jgi:hypothetical protein
MIRNVACSLVAIAGVLCGSQLALAQNATAAPPMKILYFFDFGSNHLNIGIISPPVYAAPPVVVVPRVCPYGYYFYAPYGRCVPTS